MIYENLQVLEIEAPQAPPILPLAYFLCSDPSSGSSPNCSPLVSVSQNSWAQPGEDIITQDVCRTCNFTFNTSVELLKFWIAET